MAVPSILWFRDDLRLSDHAALAAAARAGPVVPAFVLDGTYSALGGAARWWLRRALMALGGDIAAAGLREYATRRDVPADPGTSRLSPDLRWGHLSPFRVWRRVRIAMTAAPELEAGAGPFCGNSPGGSSRTTFWPSIPIWRGAT